MLDDAGLSIAGMSRREWILTRALNLCSQTKGYTPVRECVEQAERELHLGDMARNARLRHSEAGE
jgi:hypothetical protein